MAADAKPVINLALPRSRHEAERDDPLAEASQPPPLDDVAAWKRIIAERRLGAYRPGLLVAAFDSREPHHPREVTDAIFAHLYFVVDSILRASVRRDTPDQVHVAADALDRTVDKIMDPGSSRGLRDYFTSYVKLRGRDATRRAAKRRARHDDIDRGQMADPRDAAAAVAKKVELDRVLASIENPDHRRAVSMSLEGLEYEEIAEMVGRTPDTVSIWVRKFLASQEAR